MTNRVVVAMPTPLSREGVRLLLTDAGLDVVATASAPSQLQSEEADVAVVDVDGTDELLADVAALHKRASHVRIVGLHDGLSSAALDDARRVGVAVLVDLTAGVDTFVDAVTGARDRTLRRWESPRIGPPPLTDRERDVLTHLARGASVREIATSFGIGVNSVERAKRSAIRKLGADDQAAAIAEALRAGLVDVATTPRADPTAARQGQGHVDQGVDRPDAVAVVGSRRLLVAMLERVLQSRGVCVTAESRRASVIVRGEPDAASAGEGQQRAVVLTQSPIDGATILDLVLRGADAVVPFDCSTDDLVDAVNALSSGGRGLTLSQQRLLVTGLRQALQDSSTNEVDLTARERDVLDAICRGVSVKQTARRLGIAPKTVENTRRVLYRKLAVKNRAQAVARAFELGIVEER